MSAIRQKRIILWVILILAAAVALLAILYLTSDRIVEQGRIEIFRKDQKRVLKESDIARVPVKGELVNGKGESVNIDAKGSLLADVLTLADIDPAGTVNVKITSQDEYSAEISGEELLEPGKVYLIVDSDSTFTLVVFGDSNSKRKVKNAARIEVDPQ